MYLVQHVGVVTCLWVWLLHISSIKRSILGIKRMQILERIQDSIKGGSLQILFEAMPFFTLTTPIFNQRPHYLHDLSQVVDQKLKALVGELQSESFCC